MNTKRYSVFISSTFEDLREERRAVQDSIIEVGDFPVQMESFPASDQDAFELITSLLDQCDYYVLIIGGRYGTVSDDGVSFTHKEFRYALEKKIPVLVMLNDDRGKIPAEKVERTEEGLRRLEAFIKEASTGRTRKTWRTVGDLKSAVLNALANAKQTKPRIGWVRGDAVANVEVLEQLNEVRQENAKFREAIGTLEVNIPHIPLPPIEEAVDVEFVSHRPVRGGAYGSSGTVTTTWLSLFLHLHPNLQWGEGSDGYWIDEGESCISIGSSLVQEVIDEDARNYFKLTQNAFRKVLAYYIEAGLMLPQSSDRPFTEIADRLARRHHFAKTEGPAFQVTKGKAKVYVPAPAFEPDGMDDDIPF